MREFKEIIFLGDGRDSMADCYKLHIRLEDGLETLSGLQQPFHPKTASAAAQNKRERKRAQSDLEDIVKDITVALLGKESII